jgi:hypothetical protein
MYKLKRVILMILFWLILISIVCQNTDDLIRKCRSRTRTKTQTELEIERMEGE